MLLAAVPWLAAPAVARDDCNGLRQRASLRATEATFELERAEHAFREGEEVTRLRLTRARLASKAAEAEAESVGLICSPSGDELPDPVRRQRLDVLHRKWLQFDCHRMGKDLAIAELDGDAVGVAYYAPKVEACIASGAAAGEVHYPTADGGTVHARLRGEGGYGVVLAHGGRFTKESWDGLAGDLAAAGYRVLAFDFRGRGRSRGPADAQDDPHHDVLASVRYLRDTGSPTVAVIGASFGGGAAAEAATVARAGEIQALVLLAHAAIDDPERIQGRKLFIVARDDVRGGGVRRLDEIRAQYEAAPEPKRLLVLDGAAHAQFLFETDQADRLRDEILAFLATTRDRPVVEPLP